MDSNLMSYFVAAIHLLCSVDLSVLLLNQMIVANTLNGDHCTDLQRIQIYREMECF